MDDLIDGWCASAFEGGLGIAFRYARRMPLAACARLDDERHAIFICRAGLCASALTLRWGAPVLPLGAFEPASS